MTDKNRLGLRPGTEERDSRATETREHTQDREVTDDMRRQAFRDSFTQGKLPSVPHTPGTHYCWVSLMHQEDTPHRRQQFGYTFVHPSELPGFDVRLYPASANTANSGDRVQVQEMVLMKIPSHLFQDFMEMNHVERPNEEAEKISAKVQELTAQVHEARLGNVIESEGLIAMRQAARAPDFVAEETRRTA